MSRHPNDLRSSTPAVQRARERIEGSKQKGLVVKVDELDEGGVDLKETISSEALSTLLDDGKSPRWHGGGDAKLELHLEREASFVRVTGKASFPLVHPCVRCLNDVPFDIELDVDLRLVQRHKPATPGAIEADFSEGDGSDDLEGAPLGSAEDLEDIDIASYEGDVVHVDEVLREQLFLDLPMHPACDSPRAHPKEPCAFDASQASSDGSRGFTESRWAGLASLRDKLPPGPSAAPAKNGTAPAALAPSSAKPTSTPEVKPTANNAKPAETTPKPKAAKQATPTAKKAKPAAAKKAKPSAKASKPKAAKKAASKPKPAKKAASKSKPAKKGAKPKAVKKAASKSKPAKASSKSKPAKKAAKSKAAKKRSR